MANYPVMLHLENQPCVVVGGGKVATRKVQGLLEAQAYVIVISPTLTPTLARYFELQQISWHASYYAPTDLQYWLPRLVFAATDDSTLNQRIAEDARQIGAWANIADESANGDFSTMATLQRHPLTIALSSDGASPALIATLKQHLGELIGEEYTILAHWLGEIRPTIKAGIPTQEARRAFYHAILASDVLSLLRVGDIENAWALFTEISNVGAEYTPSRVLPEDSPVKTRDALYSAPTLEGI
jgi:precorrin-2 dehydrogenase / sirohydrochlorin ferrochelatase